ncbi:MAG: GTP-binding protein, partial [Prosthecobacter sp.]
TSVGITSDGEMDGTRLITWLAGVVLAQGADLFRMKGVFALQGDPRKVVVQSVHHVFMNGEQAGEWGEQARHCSVVFIGRNLDRQQLNADFQNCLV